MTPDRPSIIERAYELARTGSWPTIGAIKQKLQSEGYSEIDAYLDGPQLRSTLRTLIADAQKGIG